MTHPIPAVPAGADERATAVPLLEQLRSVPLSAVLRIDTPNALGCMDTRSIPVGRLCFAAADELAAWNGRAVPAGSADLQTESVQAPQDEHDAAMLWLGQVRDDFRRIAEDANKLLREHCNERLRAASVVAGAGEQTLRDRFVTWWDRTYGDTKGPAFKAMAWEAVQAVAGAGLRADAAGVSGHPDEFDITDYCDAERFRWYFSDKRKGDWVLTYLNSVRTGWTLDQWRAAVDAAMAATLPPHPAVGEQR